jgi:RHS repeat-associated protein
MNTQSAGKWLLALLVMFFSAVTHAETYYLDSNYDDARPHYRTMQEACVTGELESRIDGYRASETNPNVRYRLVSENMGPDDGLGEFPCRAVIERTYASIWVSIETVDTLVYGPFGSSDPCNIAGYGDPDTGQCGSPKCTAGTANCCDVCSNGSNPIHTASGNKYQRETDYVGTGLFPLHFERTYSSNRTGANQPVPMGTGWSHAYLGRLVAYPSSPGGAIDRVVAYRADGRVLVFALSGSTWQATPDVRERLVAQTNGWQLTTPVDEVETYDAEGRLTSIASREGYVQALSYLDSGNHPRDQVRRVTDPQGHSLTFTYDAAGRLSQLTDANGQVIGYGYDAANNLATVTYPTVGSGTVTRTYHYNETGQTSGASLPHALTGIVDENNARYASWGYTANGRANLSVHGAFSGGTVDRTALLFNSNGTTTVTDALGQARVFGFSVTYGVARQASLDKSCNYCGRPPQTETYDANGYPATATDFNGYATHYTFDARGLEDQRVEAVGQPEQRTLATTWNSTFHIPQTSTVADALGVLKTKTAWVYNTRGQPLARCEIDPAQASGYTCAATGTPPAGVRRWTYSYCDAVDGTQCPLVGLLLSVDGPRTDVTDLTQYSYYLTADTSGCGTAGGACHQAGDLYQITDALGHTATVVAYDSNGRVVRQRDANGVLTDFTYHPRGWLLSRTARANASGTPSAQDAMTQVTYDGVGDVTQIVDPDGVTMSYTYDAAHRLTDVTDALGNRIHYTLDAMGNKTKAETLDAGSTVRRTVSLGYNALNELLTVTDALSQTVLSYNYTDGYDANGNPVHSVDGLGFQRLQSYDGLNRLVGITDNYNGTDTATQNALSVFARDALDRTTTIGDPDGLDTTYTFDGLSNRTAQQSPDTGPSSVTYDAAGNLLSRTDARSIASAYTYDALNRIASVSYPDSTQNVAYHYDDADSVTGCSGSYPVGRLTRVVENGGGTVFCYDLRGNVTRKQQTTSAGTDTTSYAYTLADRPSGLTYPSGGVVAYVRDVDGRIQGATLTPPGGSTATAVSAVTYLPFGPIASYTLGNGQAVTRSYDTNYRLTDLTSPALALHFARDAMGNIVALGNTPGASPATETYAYDPLYRLTTVTEAGGAVLESYTYNKTGDRLSKAATGPVTGTGTYSYTSGTHQLIGIGSASRTNDANGNTTGSVMGGETFGFGYSDRNRMTLVQRNGSTVGTYTYNAFGQRIGKSASFPLSVSQRYGYDEGSRLLDEYGTSNRDYVWVNDLPVAVVDQTVSGGVTTSTVSYVHADGLGTPRAVADSSGTVTWQWVYQGNPFGEQSPTSSTGYVFNLRYPGQYHDAESKTNYNLFRAYESATGRYLQSDPIGLAGGISTYIYVGGNPLNNIDSLGLRSPTAGEIAMLTPIFNNTVDFSKVDIESGAGMDPRAWGPIATSNAVTLGNTIHFPSSGYQSDFSAADLSGQAWLAHEMTHIYQYQNEPAYSWVKAAKEGTRSDTYLYGLKDHGCFSDYRYEQQAAIVADYYIALQRSWSPGLVDFERLLNPVGLGINRSSPSGILFLGDK